MIKPFEFYFDFGSPYSFLAHKEIIKIEKNYQVKILYKPILLGGLIKLTGNKANIDIPTKGKYMIRDCKLCAEKKHIEFHFNNFFPIKTLNLMRCALVAQEKDFFQVFINTIFDAMWKNGLNLNDVSVLKKLIKKIYPDSDTFLLEAENPKIKNDLKKRTDEAYNKGIFGVPTFFINNKIFWGQDRLEFVLNEAQK